MNPGQSVASPRSIDVCGAGDWQITSCINNLVALHDDDGVLHEGVRFAIEHPRSLQCY